MCKTCYAPFFTAEIFGRGIVYLCCPSYTKLEYIGNIFEQSWDEIWNCEAAKKFREKILKGDFSECNTNFCNPDFFPMCHEVKYIDSNKLDFNNPKARLIKFSMDNSCNVACTICRNEIRCNDPARVEFLDSHIEKTFLPILKDAEIVNFTGTGDPFASKHDRKFIKLITEKYPHIKFDFHSNGILCDQKNLENLNVIDKLSTIQISLHSAKKETYDKIVKFGNWEKLNNNLEFLKNLIEIGKLNELQLNFVILSENYKDIPEFIELCKKYKAKAFFWQYRDIKGVYDYDSVNVFSPLHKNHIDFIKIINNIPKDDPNIFMSPLLRKYTQIKNIYEYDLYSSIFANQMQERYETKDSIFHHQFDDMNRKLEDMNKKLEDLKIHPARKIIPYKLGRLISCFIPKKKNRHHFMDKWVKIK